MKRKQEQREEPQHDRPTKLARPDGLFFADVANARHRVPAQLPKEDDRMAALLEIARATQAGDESRRTYWLQKLQKRLAALPLARRVASSFVFNRAQPSQPVTPPSQAMPPPPPPQRAAGPPPPPFLLVALPKPTANFYVAAPPNSPPLLTASGALWKCTTPPPAVRVRGKVSVRSPGQLAIRRTMPPSPLGPRPLRPPHVLGVRTLTPQEQHKLPRRRDVEPDYHRNATHAHWVATQPALRALSRAKLRGVLSKPGGVREIAVRHHQEMLRLATQRVLDMRMAQNLAYCGYNPQTATQPSSPNVSIWARRR